MATVEKATLGMFDDIHALLKGFNNPRLGADEWRRLFTHPWASGDGDAPGYVLVSEGAIVGFLGTIYSERMVNGRMEKFCNVSSWIVRPEFRGESIKMVLPLVRMDDCTITNFSPSTTVAKIFEQLGFQYLDTHARIFFPMPHVGQFLARSPYAAVTDASRIPALLADHDRKLFQDHTGFPCEHIVLSSGGGGEDYCYCISTTIVRNKLHFNHIQYISNPAIFLKHTQAVGVSLFMRTGAPFLKVDCRLLNGATSVAGSIRIKVTSPRMYKSERLTAAQVDNLYSELIVLPI